MGLRARIRNPLRATKTSRLTWHVAETACDDVSAAQSLPKHVSTDHDPLFRFHRWLANLRVLDIDEIKSVPYMPGSHPFVERLIGTIRREHLDRVFFWNAVDLARKLGKFSDYYNVHRVHRSLDGATPAQRAGTLTCSCLAWSPRLAATLPRSVPDPIAI